MKIVVKLHKERETKNKVLYVADLNGGNGIDSIYVDKTALRAEGQKGLPDEIDITVEF